MHKLSNRFNSKILFNSLATITLISFVELTLILGTIKYLSYILN